MSELALVNAIVGCRDATDALVIAESVKTEWLVEDAVRAFVELVRETRSNDAATLAVAASSKPAFRNESLPRFLLSEQMEQAGGIPSNAERYIREIRDNFEARERRALAKQIERHADNPDKCAQLIAAISATTTTRTKFIHISEGLRERLADREQGIVGDVVPSHLPELDSKAPIRKGHVTVIAANTSVGKSTFALNIVRAAAKQGHAAAIVSLEMQQPELSDKVLAMTSGVDGETIEYYDDRKDEILAAIPKVDALPIHVLDTVAATPAGITAHCRKQMQQHPFSVLVVDYLQLMTANKPSGRRDVDVSACSRAMKLLAMELDVAVILISQFNRTASETEPKLHHLKESGSIEQDASLVILLHEQDNGPMKVIVAKQRGGRRGFHFFVHFDGATSTFKPAADAYLEPNEALTEFA